MSAGFRARLLILISAGGLACVLWEKLVVRGPALRRYLRQRYPPPSAEMPLRC